MPDKEPEIKSPESLFREASKTLSQLEESMPDLLFPLEPWTYDDTNKPILNPPFTEIDFLLALEDNPEANRLYGIIYALFKEASVVPAEQELSAFERTRFEINELLGVYDEETLHHLSLATTWDLARADTRRTELRDGPFRELQSKITELVKSSELQQPNSISDPELAWFWKDMLPKFLRIRSAHGVYSFNVLKHDMPRWAVLYDYLGVDSTKL
jgi:hypothetical protein